MRSNVDATLSPADAALARDDRTTYLEVMARQYLGCPASSASVQRLFSKVGIAFSAKLRYRSYKR